MQKIDPIEILLGCSPEGPSPFDDLCETLCHWDESLEKQYRRYAAEQQERDDRMHTTCSIPDWSY